MMNVQVLDFAKICRTCLGSDKRMKCLFPGDSGDSKELDEIRKMISDCTIYPVLKNDHLPNNICSKCISKVRVAYDFKSQCERAFEMLLSVMETYNLGVKADNHVIPAELVLVDSQNVKEEIDNFYPNSNDQEGFDSANTEYGTVGTAQLIETVKAEGTAEHKCTTCPKVFSKEVHLRKHMATVHPNSEDVCSLCSKNCGNPTRLKKHMLLCHSESSLDSESNKKEISKSTDCVEEFESVQELSEHICSNDNSFDPTNVEAILGLTGTKEEKEEHASDSGDPAYLYDDEQCDENENDDDESCDDDKIPLSELLKPKTRKKKRDKSSLNKTDADSNQSKDENKSPVKKEHKCDICNKIFSRSSHLKRHKFTHSEEKPFVCKECNKGFTRADHLRLHKFNHSTVKPYICPDCNRGFIQAERLKRHQERGYCDKEKNPNPKTEFCTICGKGFTTAKYLAIHVRTHTDRKWNCKHCPEVFDSKQELTGHSKTHAHETEKPFLCSECGLRFVRNDYLIIHMRRHKGEKPYKCKYCSKGFPRATDLNVHERYHTGEKTHLCTVCGKGFQRAYNLLVHMRVHTGERPYKCPHCTKCFAQGNDLKSHIRRHTGERFKCEVCEEGFIQGYHLTQHKRNVHGIDAQSHIRRVEKFVTQTEQQQQMEAIRQQQTETRGPNDAAEMHNSDGEHLQAVKCEDGIAMEGSYYAGHSDDGVTNGGDGMVIYTTIENDSNVMEYEANCK